MALLALRQPLLHRVSWGALFAGFFFGFGVWMLLLALGAGIGLAAFDPHDLQSWQGLGIGFGIWGVIAGIAAMFLAGWLTARLGAAESKLSGVLHGAALWGFMLVAGLWIATMAVTRTAGTAAQAAGGAAEVAAADPQARQEIERQADRAEQQVQGMAQELRENPVQAAETTRRAGATGAWTFFLYGLLTLAAAAIGGSIGAPSDRDLRTRVDTTAPLPGEPLPHRV